MKLINLQFSILTGGHLYLLSFLQEIINSPETLVFNKFPQEILFVPAAIELWATEGNRGLLLEFVHLRASTTDEDSARFPRCWIRWAVRVSSTRTTYRATIRSVSAPFRWCAHARGHITAESQIYDRAHRPYKRRLVIVFISMLAGGSPGWIVQEEARGADVLDLTAGVAL